MWYSKKNLEKYIIFAIAGFFIFTILLVVLEKLKFKPVEKIMTFLQIISLIMIIISILTMTILITVVDWVYGDISFVSYITPDNDVKTYVKAGNNKYFEHFE